jgi:hypothetical protein
LGVEIDMWELSVSSAIFCTQGKFCLKKLLTKEVTLKKMKTIEQFEKDQNNIVQIRGNHRNE